MSIAFPTAETWYGAHEGETKTVVTGFALVVCPGKRMEGERTVKESLLENKKILIVDDEPDVLETLSELLSMCELVAASTYEEARHQLETERFDIVIVDIMGVDGYALLEIANRKKIPTVMLTANALSVEDTVKSFRKGAVSYVPKEKMANIGTFLGDIFDAQIKGKNPIWRWLDRLGSFYDKKFGPDWKKHDKEFWEKLHRIQYWR